jgi:hypothetical protein
VSTAPPPSLDKLEGEPDVVASEDFGGSTQTWRRLVTGAQKLAKKVLVQLQGEDKAALTDSAKRAGEALKLAKEQLAQQVAPHQKRIDDLRNAWALLTAPLTRMDSEIRDRLRVLVKQEQDAAKAEEERLRKEAAEAFKRQEEAERKAAEAETPEERIVAQVDAARAHSEVVGALMDIPAAGPVVASGDVGKLSGGEEYDYEVTDIGAFATAHPDLVEIRRGPTLKLIRKLGGVAVPGLKLKKVPKISIR